jgi:hypothetical protein
MRKSSKFVPFGILIVCFVVMLLGLFYKSLETNEILFSNDGPLGANSQIAAKAPESFRGVWLDLNSIGFGGGASLPTISGALFSLFSPVQYAKWFVPIVVVFAGLCAYFFYRRTGLSASACVIGALAVSLNSDFFSTACWGVGPQTVCFGLNFLALGLLSLQLRRWNWLKYPLAGAAVGMGVMEGFDIGALFSLCFAAFVFYSAWVSEGPLVQKLAKGIGALALVAVFAGFIAAQALSVLIGTGIKGVAGAGQDAESKAQRWDWATQWSLPKRETLSFIVPGLFGYRMDTPDGGNYWGASGRDPAWDRYFAAGSQGQPPGGFMRFAGGGSYAGVVVVFVAVWAAAQALRKKDSVFSYADRKLLWFWMGVVVVTIPLAWGRFAPFYQFLYALPYFSTIRNPSKFVHLTSFALLILFGYGVDGLWRRYLGGAAATSGLSLSAVKTWLAKAGGFEKQWVRGCLIVLGVSLLAWLVYASSKDSLERYLQTVQFDEGMAKAIAGFSIAQVGWFILFFVLSAGLLVLIMSGVLAGPRAKWAAVLLGLIVVVDLGRANQPWIKYWDYAEKYATNPILDKLKEKPYEHRVAGLPRWFTPIFNLPQQLAGPQQYLDQLYTIEWAQHHFLYYNIQSLDVVQMPRVPADLAAYDGALQPHSGTELYKLGRKWELTNTRYLLASAAFLDVLNQVVDPGKSRFRIAERFTIEPKPGVLTPTRLEELTAVPSTNGAFAVIDFTGALPRAKLYANWEVQTNDQTTLTQLASKEFDPAQKVFVAGNVPAPAAATLTNQNPGKAEFTSYAPKEIKLRTESEVPTVLLLNDRFDPNWRVLVDGKAENLLRCNFIMRGVYLGKGPHTVELRFQPSIQPLYVSLAGIIVAAGLAILVFGVLCPRIKPEEQPAGVAAKSKQNDKIPAA